MQYTLLETITTNTVFTSNEDGTLTATLVVAKIGIVGAPTGKFIQADIVPPFNIPANQTSATQPAYIQAQAQAYVTATYPNT